MNAGSVNPSNDIKTTSKIIIKREHNTFRFSCETPIFLSGYIKKSNKYIIDLILPKIIFHQSHIKIFEGVRPYEKICIFIYDMMDKKKKIHVSARIGRAIDNDISMYIITFEINATITIPTPVLFICGVLIRIRYLYDTIESDDNNFDGIKILIREKI